MSKPDWDVDVDFKRRVDKNKVEWKFVWADEA